jgi:hypothetical protein
LTDKVFSREFYWIAESQGLNYTQYWNSYGNLLIPKMALSSIIVFEITPQPATKCSKEPTMGYHAPVPQLMAHFGIVFPVS